MHTHHMYVYIPTHATLGSLALTQRR